MCSGNFGFDGFKRIHMNASESTQHAYIFVYEFMCLTVGRRERRNGREQRNRTSSTNGQQHSGQNVAGENS